MDIAMIAAEVAAAVGLAEGESGVLDILLAVARNEPVATSQIGRTAELPVPIVTAVCNELRKRGVIDKTRPVRLTATAREVLAAESGGQLDPQCPCCAGLGLRIPDELAALNEALEADAAGAPQARMELDQTHCTVHTKIRRVLKLHQVGALTGRRIVLLGDDDLIAIAIARFAGTLGIGTGRLTVIDTDPDVLGWIGARVAGLGVDVELVKHDLRSPLPGSLTDAFDVACTDPPYTVPGAELFLSRAVSALAGRPGEHVFFSFGPRRPAESLATQRLIAEMGLVVRSVTPGFNSYLGAGILAGTSHLYHLRTSDETAPLIDAEYLGPLYTADARAAQSRPYRCAACGSVYLVGRAGPGEAAPDWAQIKDLQAAGCPACGGTTFRPMPRVARLPAGFAKMLGVDGQDTRYVVRQAGDGDLAAIAAFEVDIAKVSFGDDAITDAAFHRRRVAGALGKPGEIALIATAPDAQDMPLGWAWMSARTNSLTGERYGNFRSLAVADVAARGVIGQLLMSAVLRAAEAEGLTHLSGKVNAANVGMRVLYRAFGFSATHLTMEKRIR